MLLINTLGEIYLSALLLTIIIEGGVYIILSKLNIVTPSLRSLIIIAVIVNTATNPLMNFIYLRYGVSIIILETGVVITEAFLIYIIYKLLSIRSPSYEPFAISFSANLVSIAIGTPLLSLFISMII